MFLSAPGLTFLRISRATPEAHIKVKVKICGLTRPRDAALAAELGAWALGVILAPESPRRVSLERAADVLAAGTEAGRRAGGDARGPLLRTGVFVNAAIEEIEEAVRILGLTAVQLHGEESPAQCAEVRSRTGLTVIKALRVEGKQPLAGVVQFDTDLVLLDTYHPGLRGGTGETFDWSLAAGLPGDFRSGKLVLSGGLQPGNAAAAVATVGPFAVDVSSGVEAEPGVKDEEKLKRLFEALG